jgi:hypothetical protein
MFSDDEMKSIVQAVLRGRSDIVTGSPVGDGIERALDWGTRVRAQSLLLDLILSGQVDVFVMPNGEIRFTRTTETSEASGLISW